MKNYKTKDLMIPLSEYATVSVGASLYEAMAALEESQKKEPREHPHRSIIVLNKNGKVIGKIGIFDALRALEPQYTHIFSENRTSSLGFSPQFLRNIQEQYNMWEGTIENICKRSFEVKVEEFMYTPKDSEYIYMHDSMDRAIHHLVMERHQSLLVKDKDEKIVGVLRLPDVVSLVFKIAKECQKTGP